MLLKRFEHLKVQRLNFKVLQISALKLLSLSTETLIFKESPYLVDIIDMPMQTH